MFSFSSISLFATVALAAFSSAAPTFDNISNKGEVNVLHPGHVSRAPCHCAAPGVKSLVGIVTDMTTELNPVVAKLSGLTKDECTYNVVKVIVDDACTVIKHATEDVKKLVGYPVASVLKTVDGALTLTEFCGLLAALIKLVFTAIGVVLSLIGDLKGEVFDLLCYLGIVFGTFLQCVFEVLASVLVSLLATLCPLINGIFWVIIKLRLSYLIVVLKISV